MRKPTYPVQRTSGFVSPPRALVQCLVESADTHRSMKSSTYVQYAREHLLQLWFTLFLQFYLVIKFDSVCSF